MEGINGKINYNQSATECRDKLVNLCTKWEMDDSDKTTMTLEVDDYFMSTIYSVIKLLDKPNMREKIKEYSSELDTEIDRCMLWVEEHTGEDACQVNAMEARAEALTEVKNDLQSRLNELI